MDRWSGAGGGRGAARAAATGESGRRGGPRGGARSRWFLGRDVVMAEVAKVDVAIECEVAVNIQLGRLLGALCRLTPG